MDSHVGSLKNYLRVPRKVDMARKSRLLCGAFVLLVLPGVTRVEGLSSREQRIETPEQCFATAAASGLWALEVVGMEKKADSSRFTLSIDFRPAPFGPSADQVEVWAEPSHTPLFIGARSLVPMGEAKSLGAEPLTVARGLTRAFSQELTLPYSPSQRSGDQRIVVKMRVGDQDLLIAAASVNVNAFRFASTFDLDQSPGEGYSLASYHHCCSGGRCGKLCTDCTGPYFTCDLILCEIDCDQPF